MRPSRFGWTITPRSSTVAITGERGSCASGKGKWPETSSLDIKNIRIALL